MIELHGHDVAIASVLVELEGQPFTATHRQVRTWRRDAAGAWRVIAAAAIARHDA